MHYFTVSFFLLHLLHVNRLFFFLWSWTQFKKWSETVPTLFAICGLLQHPLPLKPGCSWALKRQWDISPVEAQMSVAEEPGGFIHGHMHFRNGVIILLLWLFLYLHLLPMYFILVEGHRVWREVGWKSRHVPLSLFSAYLIWNEAKYFTLVI